MGGSPAAAQEPGGSGKSGRQQGLSSGSPHLRGGRGSASIPFFLPLPTPPSLRGPLPPSTPGKRRWVSCPGSLTGPRRSVAGRRPPAEVRALVWSSSRPAEGRGKREGGAPCGASRPRCAGPPPHHAVALAHGLNRVKCGGGCGPRGGRRRRAAPRAPFPGGRAGLEGRLHARPADRVRDRVLRHPQRGVWAGIPGRSRPLHSSSPPCGLTSSPGGLALRGPGRCVACLLAPCLCPED